MINTPYHIEGFKIWGEMQTGIKMKTARHNWYMAWTILNQMFRNRHRSKYLRPYEKVNNNIAKDGYRWSMAHYLTPYNIQHFDITSSTGNVEDSPIYQNPYWPTEANMPAIR